MGGLGAGIGDMRETGEAELAGRSESSGTITVLMGFSRDIKSC